MHPVAAASIFALQAAALGADEFVFHHRRGLPRWERWGHPSDTLVLLACIGITLIFPFREPWVWAFFGGAVFSCLWVTKDEWVHAAQCSPAEHWLHAVLFLLHPTALWAAYGLWQGGAGLPRTVLWAEAMLCVVSALYQILYWNFPWRHLPE